MARKEIRAYQILNEYGYPCSRDEFDDLAIYETKKQAVAYIKYLKPYLKKSENFTIRKVKITI
jgi:hypothetical protein